MSDRLPFTVLIERYGSASKALERLPELSKRGGRVKNLHVPPLPSIEKEYERLQKIGGEMICACEPDYPLALGATEDAPPVLSVLGNADLMHKNCIAMVGARNASLNGRKFAEKDFAGTRRVRTGHCFGAGAGYRYRRAYWLAPDRNGCRGRWRH